VCRRGRPARPTRSRSSSRGEGLDPAPFSTCQLRALGIAVVRELSWGLPRVAKEVKYWRGLAERIPDQSLRKDALSALKQKRAQTDGAALFTVLTRSRSLTLLRLLTAYQLIWDYLDSVHEQAPSCANGDRLHLALVDALDIDCPTHDYYRYHPWKDDGGYLKSLVNACRGWCEALPGYRIVRAIVVREARRAQVLTLNHERNAAKRERSLRAWASTEFPGNRDVRWYELTGAASAGLTIFAMLALAAEPSFRRWELDRVYDTYFPWMSALATMLDSYVDRTQDLVNGDHVYVDHYPTTDEAVERTCELVRRSLSSAKGLRYGERHMVIAASMVAMYLSKDSARMPSQRASTKRIADAGGSLTQLLLPILRLWRTAYALHSA
jgi:tetraprenyl-beta-curcumene synthase